MQVLAQLIQMPLNLSRLLLGEGNLTVNHLEVLYTHQGAQTSKYFCHGVCTLFGEKFRKSLLHPRSRLLHETFSWITFLVHDGR